MRSTSAVLRHLTDLLGASTTLTNTQIKLLCDVEIGLYLQARLMPSANAGEAWALFSGYPFARARGAVTGDADELMTRVARHTLWTLRRRTTWRDALETYQQFDRVARAFDVPDPDQPALRRDLSMAPWRWDNYDRLLRQAPPFEGKPLPTAAAGTHGFPVGRTFTTVRLPDTSGLPAPTGYDLDLHPAGGGAALTFTWASLLDTAAMMDKRDADRGDGKTQDWVGRLKRIQLFTSVGDGFARAEEFTVARVQHLLGIVGAGKSTLRDVMTVQLAGKRERRVTVVVGDVAEILKLVQLYNSYIDGAAAPILGISSRQQHAQRLHRRLAGRRNHNLLAHDDPGFRYLSTCCALNALRPDDEDVPDFSDAPCDRLRLPYRGSGPRDGQPGDEPRWSERRRGCPYWSACPRHQGARDLVEARIWVASPASLVDSRVPWSQNGERVRYLELACRRSDLIIIDEADRVQLALDDMFAPAVTLVGGAGGTSLLDEVNTRKIRELVRGERTQLSDRDVENWTAAINTATAATDRLYAMLVSDHQLRQWVKTGHFNAWALQLRLIEKRYPARTSDLAEDVDPAAAAARHALTDRLDEFRDNPFGDRPGNRVDDLVGLLLELLHTNRQRRTRARLLAMVTQLFDLAPELEQRRQEHAKTATAGKGAKGRCRPQDPDEWLAERARQFEFMLLLAALEPTLSLMNTMWPRVEAALNLGFNEMYQRPPDYGPVVPEAPMGNVLGFQFIVRGHDNGGVHSGELRYFRCSGVGRELLRAMPGLAEVDGHPNTNVLLMSGSSWAGLSSRYHLAFPVGVIIEPPSEEIARIAEKSDMRVEFVRTGSQPAQVSGAGDDRRASILREIAVGLGGSRDEQPSLLEEELLALPQERRHILLLVGSYEEAALVADTLYELSDRWKRGVTRLVSDDDSVEALSDPEDAQRAAVLRRGDVDRLAQTPSQVLVAPLLAVERGHNILDVDRKVAAIGSVYFLVRPNPHPDDLGLAVHAINDWIVRAIDGGEFDNWVRDAPSLDAGAREVRRQARSQWYRLLERSTAWSRLGADRDTVTWDILVLVWQVIGRLLRGGVPARVIFVDAAFAPRLAAGAADQDTPETSLLHSMRHVLRPYFSTDTDTDAPALDRHIVQAMYKPLWDALDRCLHHAAARESTCTR